jgi:hypothetical protein
MTGLGEAFRRLASVVTPRGVTVPRYLEARARGDAAIERRFHEELLLRNGVFRTTREHRLDATFPGLIEAARSRPQRPVRVLDVACSMGVATVELHAALLAGRIDCVTCGTDLLIAARYVARADGCGLLFDSEGEVLQVDVGDWATSWRLRRSDRLLRARHVARARRLMESESAEFRAALEAPVPGLELERVPLLHRSTEGVRGLRFAEESILAPREPGPFDLIRAANILNDDYFPPDVLRQMVERLRERLAEGGTLLVARNLPGETLTGATFFCRRSGQLEIVGELNGGSGLAGAGLG